MSESCPISLGFANTTSCCKDVSCGFADVEVGMLLSPNYPNDYQNNLECAHQLSTVPGKMITIEFEYFSVSRAISLFHLYLNSILQISVI